MKTVTEVITRFRRHYSGCDAATALELFQTAYKRLLDRAEFRRSDTTFSAIVAGTREYDWAEADNRVYGVTWFESETSFWALEPIDEDNLTDRVPGWQDRKQLGEAIDVTAATAATPTVLTAAGHGYAAAGDGTRTNEVYVIGVGGVDDGYYFAKYVSATEISLYSDMAQTAGVAGDGTIESTCTIQHITDELGDPTSFYIAGRTDASSNKTGKVAIGFYPTPDTSTTNGYPYAVAHVATHAAISGATVIPYSLLDEMYFVYKMCEFWADEKDVQKASYWAARAKAEESIQIEHLKQLSVNSPETRILPPLGPFSRRAI